MPIAIINLFLVWIILSIIFLGRPKRHDIPTPNNNIELEDDNSEIVTNENSNERVAELLQRKLDELGKVSFHEQSVIVLITMAIILWLFRDPRVIPGWISIFPGDYPKVGDASVAIAILLIMFIVPKDLKYFRGGMSEKISLNSMVFYRLK